MANILVIGGSGFIGANIIKFLLKSNNRIFVYEVLGADTSRLDSFNVTLLFGKLSETDNFASILDSNKIETVIHLASALTPSSSFEVYQDEMNSIVLPTMRLLPIISKRNIKLVYFSSGGTIYGKSSVNRALKEDDRTEPICYYGVTKLLLEQMIRIEHEYSKLNYLIIRPSNPYGPGQNIFGIQGLIAAALGKIQKNEPLTIWGDGFVVRDYIYIDDLAQAVCDLLQKNICSGTYNIGSGIGYSINQIVNIINQINILEVIYTEGRLVDVPSLILDVTKIKNEINFSPLSIEDGIKSFFEYIKEHNSCDKIQQ